MTPTAFRADWAGPLLFAGAYAPAVRVRVTAAADARGFHSARLVALFQQPPTFPAGTVLDDVEVCGDDGRGFILPRALVRSIKPRSSGFAVQIDSDGLFYQWSFSKRRAEIFFDRGDPPRS